MFLLHSLKFRARLVVAVVCILLSAGALAEHVLITRSFSGIWTQTDHESQGFILQISENDIDGKVGVAYWFTYGEDLLSSWFIGVGPVEGHNIPMTLYEASGVSFLEGNLEGDANVVEVGTLTLSFHNCNKGIAAWDTADHVLGVGEARIRRLTSIYQMRCSGGISDDTPVDARPKKLEVRLHPARDDIGGYGKGLFWERADRSDFKVEVEGMPPGTYGLAVCETPRGVFEVAESEGGIEFRSPAIDDKPLLDFDPRNCLVEIIDESGVALTSGDAVLAEKSHGPDDDDSSDGGDHEVEVELTNTGVLDGARGEAEYETDGDETEFSVKIKGVDPGFYPLHVAGIERGVIEVVDSDGKKEGRLKFSDPQTEGAELLDFDPMGELVEVYLGDQVILETLFPE
jgi:hypothetical protein